MSGRRDRRGAVARYVLVFNDLGTALYRDSVTNGHLLTFPIARAHDMLDECFPASECGVKEAIKGLWTQELPLSTQQTRDLPRKGAQGAEQATGAAPFRMVLESIDGLHYIAVSNGDSETLMFRHVRLLRRLIQFVFGHDTYQELISNSSLSLTDAQHCQLKRVFDSARHLIDTRQDCAVQAVRYLPLVDGRTRERLDAALQPLRSKMEVLHMVLLIDGLVATYYYRRDGNVNPLTEAEYLMVLAYHSTECDPYGVVHVQGGPVQIVFSRFDERCTLMLIIDAAVLKDGKDRLQCADEPRAEARHGGDVTWTARGGAPRSFDLPSALMEADAQLADVLAAPELQSATTSASMNVTYFLHELPGLVHFVLVVRSRPVECDPEYSGGNAQGRGAVRSTTFPSVSDNVTVIPDIVALHAEGTVEDSEAWVRAKVWLMFQHGRELLDDGCSSGIVKDDGLQYSYSVWMEKAVPSRTRLQFVSGRVPSPYCLDTYGIPEGVRLVELYSMYVGGLAEATVRQHDAILAERFVRRTP